MSGLKIATLYSLKPHTLGLCGTKQDLKQRILKKFLQGKVAPREVKKALRKFRGAYPYYQLIAKSNKIKNPFDEKVVKAYWIGNKLFDKVKIEDLRQMIIEDFSGPGLLSKTTAEKIAKKIPKNSKPHHSFHVLKIGSVTGTVNFKNAEIKDICRVGWGKIIKLKIKKEQVPRQREQKLKIVRIVIKYQPLVGEKKIKLGKFRQKEIFWDREIVPKVEVGDWVSFHWNFLVQVLANEDVKNLRKYTLNSLK